MSEMVINNLIRITAAFSEQQLPGFPDGKSIIHYSLFYPVDNYMSFFSGILAGNDRQRIEYRATDGFTIKGSLFTQTDEHEMVLLGDLFYGFGKTPGTQNHFDGTIFIFPYHPTPPPPPVPTPDEPTEDLPPEIMVDAPLFPYIAILSWERENYTAGTGIDFYSYDPSSAQPGSLYEQLVANATNRVAMETLASEFIQSDAYYGNPQAIPPPFNIFPAFYDWLQKELTYSAFTTALPEYIGVESPEQAAAFINNENFAAIIDQLWQNYFALTILTNYNEGFFVAVSKILIICNLLQKTGFLLNGDEEILKTLLYASNILPSAIFPLPPYRVTGDDDNSNNITPYAIGQLKMARYRLLRYQQGEVARIQNVLKGEKKKLIHRSLTGNREQLTDQTLNDSETTNDSKEATHELLVEVSKTIAQLTKNINYDNLSTSYGPPTQAILNGGYKEIISYNGPSTEDSNQFATRVLNRTLSRINESVLRARVYSRYQQQEEISASLFNNQSGTSHFRGIYRWVNKVYRISVENYGNRFLFEIHIDHPAKSFKASQLQLNDLDLDKPVSPKEKGINSFTDITLENYISLFSYYEVKQLLLPPEAIVTSGAILTAETTEEIMTVPEGYIAVQAVVTGQIAANPHVTLTNITGIVSTHAFSLNTATPTQTIRLENETKQIVISVTGNNPVVPLPGNDFICNVVVTYGVTDRKMNEWKMAVYNTIMESYQRMMHNYNDRLTRFAGKDLQNNPLLLNNISKSSLENSCRSMLKNVIIQKTGISPDDDTGREENIYLKRCNQFTEEAFEWDEMTYTFNDQPSKLSYALQGQDDSLRPFLQAAYAVVYLPVRPEFNFSILYFLSSGVIEEAPYPFVPVNAGDVLVAQQLKRIKHWYMKGKVERRWEITLPTAMQVIQESNALPVFHR
ncbi:MAG TPA: hypothetical protein VF008_14485 [Niastella sp.]